MLLIVYPAPTGRLRVQVVLINAVHVSVSLLNIPLLDYKSITPGL